MAGPQERSTDNLYKAFFAQGQEATLIADRETGEIVAATQPAERLVRCSSGELLGKRVSELWADSEPSPEPRRISIRAGDGTQVEAMVSTREFEAQGRRYVQHILDAAPAAAAEQQSRLLHELVDNFDDSVLITDLDGKIVYINRKGLSDLGYDLTELAGKDVSVLQDPDTFCAEGSQILQTAQNGKVWDGETTVRAKDGTQLYAQVTAFTARDSEGKPMALVAIAREAGRRVSLLESIVEAAPEAIFTLGPDRRFAYVNRAATEQTGWTSQELLGQNLTLVHEPADVKEKGALIEAALLSGDGWSGEIVARKKSGEQFPAYLLAFPIKDSQGRVTGSVGIASDITRLREAERTAKRLADVVENTADMICITDADGKITYANRAMLQMTGMPIMRLLGTSPADFIFPTESGLGFEAIRTKTRETGYEGEVEWRAADGSIRTLWIRAFRMEEATGERPSLVYIFTEITEQRWLHRELERRHAQAQAINKMAFALREILSTQEVLERSLDVGIEVTGADLGAIYFLDGEMSSLRLVAQRGMSPRTAERLRTLEVIGIQREVMYELRTAMGRDDLGTLEDGVGQRMTAEGLCSGIMSPLWSHGRPIGAMVLATTEPRSFESSELDLATSLGSIVAAASERARLYEEAQESAMRLSLMSEAQKAVLSKMSVEEIIKGVGEHIERFFPSPIVGITLTDATGENLIFERVASNTVPDPGTATRHRIDEMAASLAIRQRRPVVRKDLRTEEHRFPFDEQCIRSGLLSSLIVPLIAEEKVIGTLNIGAREAGAFSEEDIPLAEEIANVIAVAVDNARLYSEVKRTAERLSLANEVGRAVLSTLSADEILAEIASWAKHILPCERVSLALLDPSGRTFSLKMASADWPTQVAAGEVIQVGDTALSLALSSDKPILIQMGEMKERFSVEKRLAAEGLECAIAAPLRVRDKVMGTLNVGSRKREALTGEHIPIMEELANLTAMALEKARVYEEETKRAKQLEALRFTAERLLDPTSLDKKLLAVMKCVREALEFDSGSMALVSRDGNALVRRARFDAAKGEWLADDETPLSPQRRSASGQAIFSKKSVVIGDPSSDPRCSDTREELEAEGVKALVNVPVLVGDDAVGVICADRIASDARITDEDVELLEILAQQTGLAIQNSNLIEETQRAYRELKEAQEARISAERMRALEHMAREMAHDINNLLSVIAARCEFVLEDARLSDESRMHAHAAHEKTMEGAEIVRRMQDAARVRKAVESESVDMNSLAQEAVWITEGRWHFRAARESTRYEVKTDLAARRHAVGSQAEIKQAIIDLINNALNRNPSGAKISVQTRDEGDKVVCAVVDPSPVPTSEELERLFEPFSPVEGAGEEARGSLSIAKGAIERHGGTLSAQARDGGAEFAIGLSAADPLKAARARRARPPAASEAEPLRILLVEDEPQVRELTAKMLNGLGHQTETAGDGEAALEKLKAAKFDLLMTDLGLPGIDGWEVARKAKEQEGQLPVVLITGWGDQISEGELEGSAADAVVVKPFTKKKLSAAISDALSEKS